MRRLQAILAMVLLINFSVFECAVAQASGATGYNDDELAHQDVTTLLRCVGYWGSVDELEKPFEPEKHLGKDPAGAVREYFDEVKSLAARENFKISREFFKAETDMGQRIWLVKDLKNSYAFEMKCLGVKLSLR